MIIVTFASVYVGAVDYRSQLADYQAYKNAAQANGLSQIAPSPLAPLSLLRAAMEYLEIVGAIIAITLGYLSMTREFASGTPPLIRSRPVTDLEIAKGNALGALWMFVTMLLTILIVSVLGVGLIGNDWIGGSQVLKLLIAFTAALLYLGVFYAIGVIGTSRAKNPVNGLMVALGIWLVVVLVLPQIGDTLDADNQVPGGLFSALNLGHNGEVTILKHFSGYEHIRTGIEELSIAKHFERFSFAMADVKVRDRSLSLPGLLGAKRNDIGWLIGYFGLMSVLFRSAFSRLRRTDKRPNPGMENDERDSLKGASK